MAQGYQVGIPQQLWDLSTDPPSPAVGWKITTYVGGTTTPLTTYSNPTLLSSNTNPIVTDSDGFFRCYVAKGVVVKFSVTTDVDVPVARYSFDNLEPMIDPDAVSPVDSNVPVGGILLYGASSAPTGFLLCDGTAVSRATYADLFGVISTTYGAGNGTTTFNLPDLRQRFPMGLAASGTGNVLGVTGGTIDHTHTGPSHTHSVVVTASGWGAQLNAPSTTGRLNTGEAAGAGQFSSSYQPTADLTVTSAAGGTGATSTANPPFQTFTYIVKT